MLILAIVLAALCGFAQPLVQQALVRLFQHVVSRTLATIIAMLLSLFGSAAALIPIAAYTHATPSYIVISYLAVLGLHTLRAQQSGQRPE